MMSDGGGRNCLLIWTLTAIFFSGRIAATQNQNCTQDGCESIEKLKCPPDSYPIEYKNVDGMKYNDEMDYLKDCSCRECHIPSCHNASLVLMEMEPAANVPGKCCATYDCIYEVNCTEVFNTNGHWLVDCQRCKCVAGQKICHRSCDEVRPPPSNCLSQNFIAYKNGQTWKEDECTQCECHNGEKKCQTSFCRPLACEKKIKSDGECCPVCISTVNIEDDAKDHETTNVISTTEVSHPYSVHTEIIEVVVPSKQNCILYGVIVALSIILILFITLYIHERSKQRSYRPVSALDDNFNKITGKIKSKEYSYA